MEKVIVILYNLALAIFASVLKWYRKHQCVYAKITCGDCGLPLLVRDQEQTSEGRVSVSMCLHCGAWNNYEVDAAGNRACVSCKACGPRSSIKLVRESSL